MPAIPPVVAAIAPPPEIFMKLRRSKRAMASSPSIFVEARLYNNAFAVQEHLRAKSPALPVQEQGMVGRLQNKVAIITGGGGGIGAATGLLFCEEGGRVVLVDSDSDAMGVAVSHIRDAVPGARVVA